MSFEMNLMPAVRRNFLHVNRNAHRFGPHHLYQGIRNVGVGHETASQNRSADIDWIGNGGFYRIDVLLRSADQDFRRHDFNVSNLPSGGKSSDHAWFDLDFASLAT